jgi:hypothetical protein
VRDVSRDITPLLTSFPSSEGSDVQGAVCVGHPGVVVGDATYSSCTTSLVRGSAVLFLVSVSVAQQALVDTGTVACRVPAPFTPLAAFVVLLGAVFPPVGEVIEAGVEHGSRDIRGRRGIVEDAWLEAAESVGPCKGSQGILFFPTRIVVKFLEVGQIFSQVSDVIVGFVEALHFRAEGIVSFLLDGEVDHGCKGLPWIEGVRFFACKDSSGVGVFPCPEGT